MRRDLTGLVRSLLALGALGFTLLGPARAGAQTDEQRAAARSLATDGATAFNEGRWKDAVDLFTRAESLVHAPPHLLFLARAREKLGHYVQAREAYLKITRESLPPGAPPAFRDAQAAAEQELRNVEPRIASLTIKVQGAEAAKDLSVSVDGVPVAAVLIGVARPIDPGEHKVEAIATGYRAQPLSVRLADGEKKSVVLTLVQDPNAVAPAAAPGEAAPAPGSEPLPPPGPSVELGAPTAVPPPSSQGLRIGAYVAYGVGVLGLGAGTFFLIDSRSKRKDADAAFADCEAAGECRENDALARKTQELDDDARSAMTLSIVGFAVGGVGVAAGTTLLILSSSKKEEAPAPATGLSLRPFIGFNAAGVAGRF